MTSLLSNGMMQKLKESLQAFLQAHTQALAFLKIWECTRAKSSAWLQHLNGMLAEEQIEDFS